MSKQLGDRMKEYEEQTLNISIIPKDKPFIVRLDGKCFSKFTRGFIQPYDSNLSTSMVNTMNDLISEFNAVLGYTHSDEISLVFNKCVENQEHIYGGRIIKIVSLLASYCSVVFNGYIKQQIKNYVDLCNSGYTKNPYTEQFIKKIENSNPIFDARVIIFPEDYEIINYFIWRSVHDCNRNCISSYARHRFGHKKLENKNCKEMIDMMEKDGFDFHKQVSISEQFGMYAKKVLVEHIGLDPMKHIEVKIMRHEIVVKSFKLLFDIDLLETVFLSKYWSNKIYHEDDDIN